VTESTGVQRLLLRPVAIGAAAAAGCLYLVFADPRDPHALMPTCPTKWVTGLDCPACGGLRLVHALLHGRLTEVVHDNLFLLLALPVALVLYVRWLQAAAAGRRYSLPISRNAGLAILALAAFWAVLRNLPFWPLHP
jgi:hypothetical protein